MSGSRSVRVGLATAVATLLLAGPAAAWPGGIATTERIRAMHRDRTGWPRATTRWDSAPERAPAPAP